MTQYIRRATATFDEVFPMILHHWEKNKGRQELGSGYRVGVVSLRLKSFARDFSAKGKVCCVACGLDANFFAVENFTRSSHDSPHINLYGTKDGEEVLFTRDHIVALSNNGKDCLSNSQVMCKPCNNRKGAKSNKDFMAEIQKEKSKCQFQS